MEASRSKRSALPLLLVVLGAGVLLFWKLGERALWQDEAACAVMSRTMLETGKPLAYDGLNLITMDEFQREEGPRLGERTGDPQVAVDYYVDKGDFKSDTAWIGQPWGQFVFTAMSFAVFGEGTFQARLPFAFAGVLTAVMLFAFVRRRMDDPWMAACAVLLLLGSAYWVMHVRQCRYYATSSFFLLLTVVSYFRWQERPKKRVLAAAFVLVSWLYFHNDFGSFWPVMGVLSVDAVLASWREDRSRILRVVGIFALIGILVLPFAFYYELLIFEDGAIRSGRFKEPSLKEPSARLGILLVYLNQFQFPLLFAAIVPLLACLRGRFASPARRIVLVCLAMVVGQTAWMTLVSPFPFYRYLVDMTPLASLLVAWACFGVVRLVIQGPKVSWVALPLVLFVLVTPLPSAVADSLIFVPEKVRQLVPEKGKWVRHELGILADELNQTFPDPNGELIAFLKERLRPGDEVVINYEDAPLMFYLDNPVRGGIGCFRVEDKPTPRFLVLRQSVGFTHAEVYTRLGRSRRWRLHETSAPDVTWGNNPDPWCHYSRQMDEVGNWGTIEVREDAGPN